MAERTIESIEQLIDALDAAPDDDAREVIYASAKLGNLAARDIREPAAGLTWERWLTLRACAGPPGVGLPDWQEARARAFGEVGQTSALDAYQLLMAGSAIPRDWVIRSLQNAMLIAAKRCRGHFVIQIGITWVVAMLACRRGREIQRIYDAFKFGDLEFKPPLFQLTEVLRDTVELTEHPELVRYAQRVWRSVRFPTTPYLPPPLAHREETPTIEELVERIRSAGLDEIARSVAQTPARRNPGDEAFIEQCWAAVQAGERLIAFDSGSVTDAIEEWLKDCVLGDQTGVAVIAARSLHHAGRISASVAASTLLFDLRADDLPILLEGFRDNDGLQEHLTQIARICERLDGPAADAVLWLLMPSKLASEPERFYESVEHLEAIMDAMVDAPSEMRSLIESIWQARVPSPENQVLGARVRKWFDAIRIYVAGLRTDQALDLPAFNIAVERLAHPLQKDSDLTRRALPVVHKETPLVRLIAFGALILVADEPEELQRLRFRLAQEIGQVVLPGLIPLRLQLLDEVLAGPRVRDFSIGEVFRLLGRAHMRLARIADGVATFEDYLIEARKQRDDEMIAEAICELIPARVAFAHQQGIYGYVDEWLELLGEARERSTSARQQAAVEVAILATLEQGRHQKDVNAVRSAMLFSLKALYRGMDDDDRIRISADIATAINHGNESEGAIEWIHRALDELPVREHSWSPAPLLCELGLAYARIDVYDRAILSFERASLAASECGDDLQIMHIEATNENYASRIGGVKPRRFQFVRRARQAAERIGDHQQVVHHGLREARCAVDDWQAAPALRAVAFHLPYIRQNGRFDNYSKQYQSLLGRFGFEDPPKPVLSPEYASANVHVLSRDQLEEVIQHTSLSVDGEPADVCEMLAASLTRACMEGRFIQGSLLAVRLLKNCLNINDVEQCERLVQLAFNCLDVMTAVCRFADPIMELFADATRALFLQRFEDNAVLIGDNALAALSWLGRITGLQEQQNAIRLMQPQGVYSTLWEDWLLAHHINDSAMMCSALAEIQAAAPEFLTGMPRLEPLAALLGEDETGVGVVPLESDRIALFVAKGGRRGLRGAVWTARFRRPPMIGDAPTDLEVAELNRWTAAIIRHIRQEVEFTGSWVWCAKGAASMASPWEVLPDDAKRIRSVASLAIAPARRRANRPRSTLIVYADPGPGQRGDFASAELKWLRPVVNAARGSRVEVLAARGSVYGSDLPWFGGHVIQRAPSHEAVLSRQRQNDLIVIIAHGRREGDESEIVLVNDCGKKTRLTAAQVAATPYLFSGASILLLSCSTGVAGHRLHRPAGFAGACLAAGAIEVLAPLRAVPIDVAIEIGSFIVRSFGEGHHVSEALAEFMCSRRQGRGRDSDFTTFVCWVG